MSQANPTDTEAGTYAADYILHGCQTKAFRATFPESKGTKENTYTKSSLLHAKAKVQQRIKELQAISKANSEKEFLITTSFLKETLARVIAEGFKTKTDKDQNTVPISLTAIVSAANEINKMDGNHAETRVKLLGEKENPIPFTMEPAVYKAVRKEMLEELDI